jgi:AmiR/NasT family two-component response regulator
MDSEDERRVEQLTIAVEHRSIIGMALGILMERHDIGAEAAFLRLRRVSSLHNRKVYDIASEFLKTRVLPEDPPRRSPRR